MKPEGQFASGQAGDFSTFVTPGLETLRHKSWVADPGFTRVTWPDNVVPQVGKRLPPDRPWRYAMRRRIIAVALSASALWGTTSLLPPTAQAETNRSPRSGHGVARQVLSAGDGWGSVGAGTTGGSTAERDHVVTVRTRDQLAAAVAGDTPKIVYVRGTDRCQHRQHGTEAELRRLRPGRLHAAEVSGDLRSRGLGPRRRTVRPGRGRPTGVPGGAGCSDQHPDRLEHDDHRAARCLDHRRGAADQRHEQRDHPRTDDLRCL